MPGCAGLKPLELTNKDFPKTTAQNPATEMLVIWQPAEGRGMKGLPARGFAGQILFFTGQQTSPVQVDGDVRIYLFDDKGTADQQTKPIHQFDFKPEAWSTHLYAGTLGPAYQVFIPYTNDDHSQSKCALRVRFQPAAGPVIYSEMTSVALPGPKSLTVQPGQEVSESPRRTGSEATDRLAREMNVRDIARLSAGRITPIESERTELSLTAQLGDGNYSPANRDDASIRQVAAKFEAEREYNGRYQADPRPRPQFNAHPLIQHPLDASNEWSQPRWGDQGADDARTSEQNSTRFQLAPAVDKVHVRSGQPSRSTTTAISGAATLHSRTIQREPLSGDAEEFEHEFLPPRRLGRATHPLADVRTETPEFN
jgi:hypothetical protein